MNVAAMSNEDARRPESRSGRQTPLSQPTSEPPATTGIEPRSRTREASGSQVATEPAGDKVSRRDVGEIKRREYTRSTARPGQKEADV